MASSQSHPSSFVLPDTLGLIVLEECFHFPGCFLPLYIFEQRYRQMLDQALYTSRMFGVGTIVKGDLLPVTTVGLIRASKKREDGTSHVMLYGVKRVRITGWVQEKPFRIATIEPFPTLRESTDDELAKLKSHALDLLPPATPECSEAMQMLRTTLDEMACPELACDILSYHFVREPDVMTLLITEPSLEERYTLLLHELRRLKAVAGCDQ
jgi:ATP-dependent Lon protease